MKKLALIGMVVAGLLLSSSVALAKPTGMTKAEYQALITRSEATNLKYGQYEYAQPTRSSQLGEIGAWAVPSKHKVVPSAVNQKLEEIGAWAVPSKQTQPTVVSSGQGFDWNDGGIGALLALAVVLCIGALLTVRHQRQRPIPH
jgi:hypothetical protein